MLGYMGSDCAIEECIFNATWEFQAWTVGREGSMNAEKCSGGHSKGDFTVVSLVSLYCTTCLGNQARLRVSWGWCQGTGAEAGS